MYSDTTNAFVNADTLIRYADEQLGMLEYPICANDKLQWRMLEKRLQNAIDDLPEMFGYYSPAMFSDKDIYLIEALGIFAEAYFVMQEKEKAEAFAHHATKIGKSHYKPWFVQGKIQHYSTKYESSIISLQNSLERMDSSVEEYGIGDHLKSRLHLYQALNNYQLGKTHNTKKELGKALETANHEQILKQIGITYEMLGLTDRAITAYQQARIIAPNSNSEESQFIRSKLLVLTN